MTEQQVYEPESEELENEDEQFYEYDMSVYYASQAIQGIRDFGTFWVLLAGILAILYAFFVSTWLQSAVCILIGLGFIVLGIFVLQIICSLSEIIIGIYETLISIEEELITTRMNREVEDHIQKSAVPPKQRKRKKTPNS